MSNERIDLTQFEKIGLYVAPEWAELIAELKKCYEEIDMLISGHMRCEGCNEWIDTTAPYSLDHQMCNLPASEWGLENMELRPYYDRYFVAVFSFCSKLRFATP